MSMTLIRIPKSEMVGFQAAVVQPPKDLTSLDSAGVLKLLSNEMDMVANRPFVDGDHFQGGDGYIGPGPSKDDPSYGWFLEILEPSFISKNVITEIADRLAGAVIGWEPRWTFVPSRHDVELNAQTDEETAAIVELTSAFTTWWDERQAHVLLKQFIFKMTWGRRATYRLYVPHGLTEGGKISGSTEEVLAKIFLDIPEPEDGVVLVDPDTKRKVGIVRMKDRDNQDVYELSYIDATGNTTIRILDGGNASNNDAATNNFGGHITIGQAAFDRPMITEQVRVLQKAYNTTLTLLQKGLVDNHFLERFFLNALPPGHWTYEEDGKTRKEYVVDKRVTGGKTDSYIQGVDYQQPSTGDTVLANPGVVIRQPLDPQGAIGGAEYWYQALLESVRQDHVLINQLATPSGKSRERSQGDFQDTTKDPVMQMNAVGRELLWTLMHMVELFSNQPGKWTSKFKPVFQCRPNYGPLSVAERQQNVTEAEKGFLSDETAMALNGTDDVDAERSLIDSQPRRYLELITKRAAVVEAFSITFPRDVALRMAGFTEKEVKEIMGWVVQSNSVDPTTIPPPAPAPKGGPSGNKPAPSGSKP